jgi:hypothetical protein
LNKDGKKLLESGDKNEKLDRYYSLILAEAYKASSFYLTTITD